MRATSWTCCGGSTFTAFGGASGALQPHGTTARLASAVFFSACNLRATVAVEDSCAAAEAAMQTQQWYTLCAKIPVRSRLL